MILMIRKATYPISEIFLNRWSPRAMTGESITQTQLMTLFEAARWAPSSYNNQPWRFLYAQRDTQYWDLYLNLIADSNRLWAKNAGALVVTISRDTFEFNNKPSRTHTFDAGSAWENLALQGSIMNLVVHGIEGFDYVRAKRELHIPDGYTVEMMFVVGHQAAKSVLPVELQEREAMSDRKPLSEIVIEGTWK
jgi:nitroreductase